MSSLGLVKDKTNKDNHKMTERQMKGPDLLMCDVTCDVKTDGYRRYLRPDHRCVLRRMAVFRIVSSGSAMRKKAFFVRVIPV